MTDSFKIRFHEDGNVEVVTDKAHEANNIFPLVVAALVLLYFLLRKTQSSIKGRDGRVRLDYDFSLSSLSTSLGEVSLSEEEDAVTTSYFFYVASELLNTNEQCVDTAQSANFSYDFSISCSFMLTGECSINSSDAAISSLSFLTRLGEIEDDDPLPPPDDAIWIVIPY